MSKLRSINTVIWSDTWFELLNPEAKLLFIYFVTNEKTNMLGVYEISIRKVSFETGIKEPNIIKYLNDFEKEGKIKYNHNRVLLLNFLKHQNYNFNMMKSAIRIYNELPKELKVMSINDLEETKEGFKTLCNGFGGVRKVEYEYEYELEEEDKEEDEEKPTPKFSFFNSLIDLGVDKDLVNDWLKVRKNKKATNSKTAFNGFIKQVEKTNKSISEVLEICVINSWSGFNSTWIKEETKPNQEPKDDNYIYYKWQTDVTGIRRKVLKSEAEELFKSQSVGGYKPTIL